MAFEVYRETTTGNAGDVAGAGDGDYSTAGNWSGTGPPSAGDDVEIAPGAQRIIAGLDQSAVAIGWFRTAPGHTGQIGTIDDYLQIDPDDWEWHSQGNAFLDIGTAASNGVVYRTGNATLPAVSLEVKGGHASATLKVIRGVVGLATREDSGAVTLATLDIEWLAAQATDAQVWAGEDCTAATVNQTGGFVHWGGICTTYNQSGGELRVDTTDGFTLNAEAGTAYVRRAGTIATLTVGPGATVDLTRAKSTVTLTNTILKGGTLIVDANVTFTNHETGPGNVVRLS